MKKVGKEVLWLKCSNLIPRNGEGAFLRLNTGACVYVYTEYVGNSWHDHANARISFVVSYDEGETWSERRVLREKGETDRNIMSVSLLRMKNNDIGLFYIRKNYDGTSSICMTRSTDKLDAWTEAIDCSAILPPDYYVLNNDRVIRLSNGRLIIPLARHTAVQPGFSPGKILFLLSDDDGNTWRKAEHELSSPVPSEIKGFEEPGILELDDGTVWCYIRTNLGCQYESFSNDCGETWSQPAPNPFFTSPRSPMQVKRLGGQFFAFFNPIPNYLTRDIRLTWGRTPFVLAISKDGRNWDSEQLFFVEDDPTNGYCYPSVLELDNGFLLAYYHSENSGKCLHSCRMLKIDYSELQNDCI